MTRVKLVMLAAGVWAGGVAGAGALAYVVSRPLPLPATMTATIPHVMLTPLVPVEVPTPPEVEHVIVLPTVEITGKVPTPPTVQPPHQRDISEMHCSAWRPLEQGSNSVQICD